MKTRSKWSTFVCAAVLVVAMSCTNASAQSNDDELFDLNEIIVKGELYIWNRVSDLFDVFRCGIGAGGDIGVDVAITEYAQLGAMITSEKGVDFPHFVPPFWMAHYYQHRPIFKFHEGFNATAAFGPWRVDKLVPVDESSGVPVVFDRNRWDIRLEVALLAHLYVNVSTTEVADFLAGFVGWDLSGDDQRLDTVARRRPADQFGRGVSNILFGVLEVPMNIMRVNDEEGDMAGATKGVALGLWRFITREVVGVVELVTFPFGWTPIIEPEYIMQKTKNTSWRVKRPSFHRRY